MALTQNILAQLSIPNPGSNSKRLLAVEFVFDGSYPAKGYTLAAATLGLTAIEGMVFSGVCISNTADTVCVPCWDAAQGKIMIGEAGADGAGLDDATAASLTTSSKCFALVFGY